MIRYLVVATEYGGVVGATPCDSVEDAEEIAESHYNPHKYHTQGDVMLLASNQEEGEYYPVRSLHHDGREE